MKAIKAYWQQLDRIIEKRSMRERLMIFVIAALFVVTLVDKFFINPQLASQQQLSQKIKADQQQLAAIQAEINNRINAHEADPDAAARLRYRQLAEQQAQVRGQLEGVQKGLVSPDKMAVLLEELLRRDGKLRLRSLRTLPVASLSEPLDSAAPQAGTAQSGGNEKAAAPASAPKEPVYKHGVEIVVEGSYADITHYLTELERMPWQLFWAGTRLDADGYPVVRLTLTLFTLSLDKTWLNI